MIYKETESNTAAQPKKAAAVVVQKKSPVMEAMLPYLFLAPFIILFVAFQVFPIIFSMYLSFHSWNPVAGLGSMKWVGLENYAINITDPWMWQSIWNTIWLSGASGVMQHLVAIPLAYILVTCIHRMRHLITSAFFLPYVTSSVVVALIFFNMYAPNAGIINKALAAFGNTFSWFFGWLPESMPLRWLEDRSLIKPAIAIVTFWKFVGFHVVIYSSGLLTISKDTIEAAVIDGATYWQRFWYLALPALRPFIMFGVTITLIGGLQSFEEPFILTQGTGGTGQSALTITMYLYKMGWEWLEMGTASALSWILFVFTVIVTGIFFLIFGRKGFGA